MSEMTTRAQTDPVVEVEFRLRSEAYPFVSVSAAEACTLKLAKMLPRPGGRYAEFFDVRGADPDRIATHASDHDTVEVSLLTEHERGARFEFTVGGDCPAYSLAELGALPRAVEGEEGMGRIVAEVPPEYDSPAIVETFLDEYDDADLVRKREKETLAPRFTELPFQRVLQSTLTDRQREVIAAAFEAGYYDWPRKRTGVDIADELGISSATFSEHVHAAERKLLSVMFDGEFDIED